MLEGASQHKQSGQEGKEEQWMRSRRSKKKTRIYTSRMLVEVFLIKLLNLAQTPWSLVNQEEQHYQQQSIHKLIKIRSCWSKYNSYPFKNYFAHVEKAGHTKIFHNMIGNSVSTCSIKCSCVKVTVSLPTDRRVGEESLEQPWLRGMRLRLRPSVLDPANTLWAPELMVLSAVLVRTRPGEPLRLPALKIRQSMQWKFTSSGSLLYLYWQIHIDYRRIIYR